MYDWIYDSQLLNFEAFKSVDIIYKSFLMMWDNLGASTKARACVIGGRTVIAWLLERTDIFVGEAKCKRFITRPIPSVLIRTCKVRHCRDIRSLLRCKRQYTEPIRPYIRLTIESNLDVSMYAAQSVAVSQRLSPIDSTLFDWHRSLQLGIVHRQDPIRYDPIRPDSFDTFSSAKTFTDHGGSVVSSIWFNF